MTIRKFSAGMILALMLAFLLSAMLLISLADEEFNTNLILRGVFFAAFIVLQYNILVSVFKHMDRFTLLIADFLCILGIVMLYRMNPEAGDRQFIWILAGNVFMIIALNIIRKAGNFKKYIKPFMIIGIALLAIPLLLPSRLGTSNWLKIGPFSFQPSEFVKVIFLIVTAYYLSEFTKKRQMLPYFLFTIGCVGLLVLSKDLGAALLFAGTFLIVFYVATGNLSLTLLSIGAFAGGAVLSYKLFDHVQTRVEVWRDPWATYDGKGYQIVQGLMAIASGGLLGTGLGNGMPNSIPVHETDYIFAAIAEEFGTIVAIALIAFYLVFIIRGILIAMEARSKFDKLLVFGATCLLSLQSFIIIGGVIKLIPLTGIAMPFVSLGGSSMMASMLVLGIIEGVSVKNGEYDEAELAEMGGSIE